MKNRAFETIFVPEWIEQVILNNGLGLPDLVHYDRVAKVLSTDDLIYLLSFQQLSIPAFDAVDFNASLSGLAMHWSLSQPDCSAEIEVLVQAGSALYGEGNVSQTQALLDKFTAASAYLSESDQDFTIHDLSRVSHPDVILYAVVVRGPMLESGLVKSTDVLDRQYSMIESVLEHLHKSKLSRPELGNLALTRKYVNLTQARVAPGAI